MLNQNLSNPAKPSENLSNLSDSFQKLQISEPFSHAQHKYFEDFRSHKRNLFLKEKRLTALNSLKAQDAQNDTLGQGLSIVEFINQCLRQTYTLENFNELVTSLYSLNGYRQHLGVIGIRKLLAVAENPPIQSFIDAGIIPKLIEFLAKEDELQLQLEAAWALSNMASGTSEQVKEIVDNGAIPDLIKLLRSPYRHIRHQIVWALGNIAADNATYRNAILQEGAMSSLVKILDDALVSGDIEMVKDGTWTLSNMCKRKPLPEYEQIREAIPILAWIIRKSIDDDVSSDALWSFVQFSDEKYDQIQQIFDCGIVPDVLRLVGHPSVGVMVPCLRIIGNICSSDAKYIDMVLLLDPHNIMIEKLFKALSHNNRHARKEAAWVLSTISAGGHNNKDLIVGNPDYLGMLFSLGMKETLEVRREIGRIFKNLLTNATEGQLRNLSEKKVVGYFFALIQEDEDLSGQEIGLEGIMTCLKFGEDGEWSFAAKEALGRLKNHPNARISQMAFDILGANGEMR